MAKITYDNKIQLNENANIPNNQKCRAVDMNEIKNIVNGNDDEFIQYKSNIATGETYSTNEIKTNKVWIDGKPIYRKVYEISSLPNNTTTSFQTNISNGNLIAYEAFGKLSSSDTNITKFPYTSPYAGTGNVALAVSNDASKITITTFTDRSTGSAYVILEYTKTTDV